VNSIWFIIHKEEEQLTQKRSKGDALECNLKEKKLIIEMFRLRTGVKRVKPRKKEVFPTAEDVK